MYRILIRILKSVNIRIERLYTSIVIKSISKKQLRLSKSVSFIGTPIIKVHPGSTIYINENALLNSSYESNPAGIFMPCVLSTITAEASIFIGHDVGLSGTSIVAAKQIRIGNYSQIGAGTCIWDNDFHPIDPKLRLKTKVEGYKSSPIEIGENVFIGARSIILKGVKIGDNSVIGAGSVVISDVPENSIYAGNPAQFIRSIKV